jgi:hypothetical protein
MVLLRGGCRVMDREVLDGVVRTLWAGFTLIVD